MRITVPDDRNARAILDMLSWAEGTSKEPDPYRAVVGYGHIIQDLSDHPCITGEWIGLKLADRMCRNAGLKPPCRSTAAGAFQMIKPTWSRLKYMLMLPNFFPASQDVAAWGLLTYRRAVPDILAGRIASAIRKASPEWASLPGNKARQGQHSLGRLIEVYRAAGGRVA